MPGRVFHLLCALSMLALLSACAAAVVGGAATGGYAVASHNRNSAAADAAITSRINTRYVQDSLVNAMDIRVSTSRGNVTLAGTVPSRDAERRAVAIARSVEGVVRVVSQLRIVSR